MKQKIICQNCGAVYEDAPDFCECGAEIVIEEENEENFEEIENLENTESILKEEDEEKIEKENKKNELDLTDDMFEDEIEKIDPPKIQIYKDKTLFIEYPFNYDEITIGRSNYKVDIDLNKLDDEKRISRNQLAITRENDKYYIRNISKKNSLIIDGKTLYPKEKRELEKDSKIVINKKIGIKLITA